MELAVQARVSAMSGDVDLSMRMLAVTCVMRFSLDDDALDTVAAAVANALGPESGPYRREDLIEDIAAFDVREAGLLFVRLGRSARGGTEWLLRQYARLAFVVHGQLNTLPAGEVRLAAEGLGLGLPRNRIEKDLMVAARHTAEAFNKARAPGLAKITPERVLAFLDGQMYLMTPESGGLPNTSGADD